MTHKRFMVELKSIVPQQHYLSTEKYHKVKKALEEMDGYGDIYVIEYKDRIFSVDGHHRLYCLYEQGVETVDVVCELADNHHPLYLMLADEALELGLRHIGDLGERFIDDPERYKRLWIDKCQSLMNTLENDE